MSCKSVIKVLCGLLCVTDRFSDQTLLRTSVLCKRQMLFKHKIPMCASSRALKDFPESSVLSISTLIALWSENALSVT